MDSRLQLDTFSTQQLQAIVEQLDQALAHHEQWYKGVLRVLVLHVAPDAADLTSDAHRHCRFGQWYHSLPGELLEDHPLFKSLGPAHERMHTNARKLLKRISAGQPLGDQEFDEFNHTLDRMRLEFQTLRQELIEMVQNRDPLTGARDRTTLLTYLRDQHALAIRGVQACTLVMVDLDHFKRINDSHGHAVGDAVLVATVRRLRELLRPYDRIYRYGGEEFLICLPGIELAEGRDVAERMRKATAAQAIDGGCADQTVSITASFGCTALVPSRSVEESIDRADQAMYAAKKAGRNRVESSA